MQSKFKSSRQINATIRSFKEYGFGAEPTIKSSKTIIHAVTKDRGIVTFAIPKAKADLSTLDNDFN